MPVKRLLLLLLLPFSLFATAYHVSAQSCLSYETDGVKLTGKIKRMTFPGPPNFESVKKGDQPEVAWILRLDKPICVKADQSNEFDEAENNVTDIQLALAQGAEAKWRAFVRNRVPVVVTGKLFHAHTGHHHTAVLMEVADIKRRQ
jgi:hypothetical protein